MKATANPSNGEADRQEIQAYFGGCVLLMIGLALLILTNYALNWEAINQAIREGQSVPVPRNHIRFSLLVAITSLIALDLGRQKAWQRRKRLRLTVTI